MSVYKAEYIWIDGTEPTPLIRAKTKVLEVGEEPPLWGFDGSSTNQAPGDRSDCVLRPVCVVPDPIRGAHDKLVLCEVLYVDLQPHRTNTRAAAQAIAEQYAAHESWFGIEQEYTFFRGATPLGFPSDGYPAPQGRYYCGVGSEAVFGREIVEAHLEACIDAGLKISGINAEVMPGQWEFQIGPLPTLEAADQIWLARYLLNRIAEDANVNVSFNPKPVMGDWNGAGAHTNFSTKGMRESYEPIEKAVKALEARHELHIRNYGYGIEQRLTGMHETCSYKEFRAGVSDRGASVRIPWQVAQDRKGYIEDRRPNANCDPYTVTRLIVETVCSAL